MKNLQFSTILLHICNHIFQFCEMQDKLSGIILDAKSNYNSYFVVAGRGKVPVGKEDEHMYLHQDLGLTVSSWPSTVPPRKMTIQVNVFYRLSHVSQHKRYYFSI